MKLFDIKYFLLLLAALPVFTACDETSEEYEYDNWQSRNEAYIDSIASVARADASGRWRVFLSYTLDASMEYGNQSYVYCEVLQSGSGQSSPVYSDSIIVNYRGRLIPTKSYKDGYVFDESYEGLLDPAVDVPQELYLAGCVDGWVTAVQEMVAGDTWRIYIPTELAYGSETRNGIPAYSALIYELNLVDYKPLDD